MNLEKHSQNQVASRGKASFLSHDASMNHLTKVQKRTTKYFYCLFFVLSIFYFILYTSEPGDSSCASRLGRFDKKASTR